MFQRTRTYDSAEARELAGRVRGAGLFGESCEFSELFYCLHDLAKSDDKESFKLVVDSLLDYTARKNLGLESPQVRFEVLARLDGICIQADMGKLVIGLPLTFPKKPGKVQSLFNELYGREVDELSNKYDLLPAGVLAN